MIGPALLLLPMRSLCSRNLDNVDGFMKAMLLDTEETFIIGFNDGFLFHRVLSWTDGLVCRILIGRTVGRISLMVHYA